LAKVSRELDCTVDEAWAMLRALAKARHENLQKTAATVVDQGVASTHRRSPRQTADRHWRPGRTSHALGTGVAMNCSGSLIFHRDGTVAGCTNDDDADGCTGRDARHESDPTNCVAW